MSATRIVKLILMFLSPTACVSSEGDYTWDERPSDVAIHHKKNGNNVEIFVKNISSFPITLKLTVRESDLYRIENAAQEPVTIQPRDSLLTTRIFSYSELDVENEVLMDLSEIPGSLLIDEDYAYSLPCSCEAECKMSQYLPEFAHEEWAQYALDFNLPEGSPVHAVRSGVVIELMEASKQNCKTLSLECNQLTNRVIVLANDGSFAEYLHLQRDGVLVEVGERVVVGQHIAYSGNTGFSSAPHLHLNVIKAQTDFSQITVPMLFNTSVGITKLSPGITYSDKRCTN